MAETRPPVWQDIGPAELWSVIFSPPDRYRPVPWLAMTGDLDWPTVEHALEEMLDKGIVEFFMFPIYGMEIPYMSAAFWDLIEKTLAFCRESGLKCWIYDEYNWPSGTCAGEVVRDHPEARQWDLCLRVDATDESADLPAGAGAIERRGAAIWTVAPFLVTMLPSQGCDWSNAARGYTSMLSPQGPARFIESTHDCYYERFSTSFSSVIPGFFTDEPALYARQGTAQRGWLRLPYAEDLFPDFAARYGYDLRDYMVDLCTDSSTSSRTRCHYWRWVAERFGQSFGRQIRDWCDARGVSLTGHCLAEESLVGHVFFSGDLWEVLRHFTIPGIDMLQNADGFRGAPEFADSLGGGHPDRRGNHLTCKMVHSIARHSGRREVMCEAYAICDWGMNLVPQKRGFNYLVAMGVTLLNDGALITSIADFRKWAYCGKHFTQPWWRHYGQFADYCARVAAIHAEGEPFAEVAVLYPRSTIWAKCGVEPDLAPLQTQLYELLDELIRAQWHFDFCFEPVLGAAHIEGSELVTEHARYRALIVPSATHLPQACMDMIARFAAAGGIVVFCGDLPEREVDTLSSLGKAKDLIASHLALHVGVVGTEVCQALEGCLHRPFALDGVGARDMVSSWRRLAGNDVFFIASMSASPLDIHIRLLRNRPFVIWDPDTGAMFRPQVQDEQGFEWHFEPWQAWALVTGQSAEAVGSPLAHAPSWRLADPICTLDKEWEVSVSPGNLLSLDLEARPDPDNSGVADEWYLGTTEQSWMSTTNRHLLAEPILPADTLWYWLRSRVDCEVPEGPQFVVCDNTDFMEVYVNGRNAPQHVLSPLWAEENVWFDVRGLFQQGANTICVRARTSKYNDPRVAPFPELAKSLQPVVLVGDFLVREGDRLVAWDGDLDVTKPWEQQGLPHFAGVGTCSRTIDWDGLGRLFLYLPACGDAVEVFVNGVCCGIRTWAPYIFDLTPHASLGQNSLKVAIYNTLGNVITETFAGRAPVSRPLSGMLAPPRLLRGD